MKVALLSELRSRFLMLLCNTRIAVITTMMEKTPTSTPSRVSDEAQFVRRDRAEGHREGFRGPR